MLHPSGDVDHTAKDEGKSCSREDQDYIERDEERPRSWTAIIRVL